MSEVDESGLTQQLVRLCVAGGTDEHFQHHASAMQRSTGCFHSTAVWYAQLMELDDSQKKPT